MAKADGAGRGGAGGGGGVGGGNAGGRGHIDPCLTMDPDCFSLNVHIFTGERFKVHEVELLTCQTSNVRCKMLLSA